MSEASCNVVSCPCKGHEVVFVFRGVPDMESLVSITDDAKWALHQHHSKDADDVLWMYREQLFGDLKEISLWHGAVCQTCIEIEFTQDGWQGCVRCSREPKHVKIQYNVLISSDVTSLSASDVEQQSVRGLRNGLVESVESAVAERWMCYDCFDQIIGTPPKRKRVNPYRRERYLTFPPMD